MKDAKREEITCDGAVRIATATATSRHSNETLAAADAGCSGINSSVPQKILKFAKTPHRYPYEIGLTSALSEEPDISRRQAWFEVTFGEPSCTFLHDKRVKIVMDVVCCAMDLHQKKFFAHCLNELRQPAAERCGPGTTAACDASLKRAGTPGVLGWSDEGSLSHLQHQIAGLDHRLDELLRVLKEQDTKIARAAEKFAYGLLQSTPY